MKSARLRNVKILTFQKHGNLSAGFMYRIIVVMSLGLFGGHSLASNFKEHYYQLSFPTTDSRSFLN